MWTDETCIRHDRIRDTLDGAFLADMREAQLADQFGHLTLDGVQFLRVAGRASGEDP